MFSMFSNLFSMLSNIFIAGAVSSESVAIESILTSEADNTELLSESGITAERGNQLLKLKGMKSYKFEIPPQ